MVKGVNYFFVNVFIVLVLYSVANFAYPSKEMKVQQENTPPKVKIVLPENKGIYELNTPIQYEISVSDVEDGESKFQEISSNEVFLQVKYLPDESKVSAELNQAVKSDSPGLAGIKASNCLNCHAFNTKLIGPSFYEIGKRYPLTKVNLDLMVKRIREGSTGVWGNITMPTHTELTREETQEMATWILKNGTEPDVNYYRGTEGSFKIKSPVAAKGKGLFVLTASYTDHGLKDKPKQNLRGQDIIMIQGK